ncbi:methyltransferase domain-containing protein [Sphingomonas profundi]|uniref:methyltransferase domain-containing protein n=1 Tax=Alterirhizorhabdus profundi TaxID=2681549 RepID=UPI0018D0B77C|nr:methyltransferase domain-containing protein [Sphingomonas profundi]
MIETIERLPPEHAQGLRKVQVGVGPKNARADWWNVDLRPFDGVDEAMDAAQPWRWHRILEFVYAEHFLEHLRVDEAVHFLVHAGNALRPGGILRLSTPALEWVLASHFTFAEPGERAREETFAINRAFYGWGHRFLFSRDMLRWLIKQLGFASCDFHDYGESGTAELRDLELHGGWTRHGGFPSVWIVEARSGSEPIAIPPGLMETIQTHFLRHVLGGH